MLRYSLIVVLIAGAAPLCATARAQETVVVPADVEDGQRLYLGACTNCHGPDGDAVPGVNLGEGRFRRASSDAELADIIRRGIPGTAMPPGNYSTRQASLIVTWGSSSPASLSFA